MLTETCVLLATPALFRAKEASLHGFLNAESHSSYD